MELGSCSHVFCLLPSPVLCCLQFQGAKLDTQWNFSYSKPFCWNWVNINQHFIKFQRLQIQNKTKTKTQSMPLVPNCVSFSRAEENMKWLSQQGTDGAVTGSWTGPWEWEEETPQLWALGPGSPRKPFVSSDLFFPLFGSLSILSQGEIKTPLLTSKLQAIFNT
jgi:hypothetical protein